MRSLTMAYACRMVPSLSPEPAVRFRATLMQLVGGENCYLVNAAPAG